MDQLKEFFNSQVVKIGEGKDFVVIPPVYYASLRDAFGNYFSTFRDKQSHFSFLLNIKVWDPKQLSFDYTGADDSIVFTILSFHRFFELLLKNVLRRINPFLAVKILEKEEEVFLLLENNLNPDEVKTIEFSETLKRFKHAFKHYDPTTEVYKKFLADYEFLNSPKSLQSLNYLAEWRNRIMHNGNTFPNVIAFEYLISQRIIPLIIKVIEAERSYTNNHIPHFFITPTGIDLMKEILDIKFEYSDFNDQSKTRKLGLDLLKLQHIKALGRGSYNQDTLIRKNRLFHEHLYENPTMRSERFAESEIASRKDIFYSLNTCNCCGSNSMVVYRQEYDDIFTNKREFNSWFKCFHCEYSLANNVGDPSYFNLSKIPIFPTK